WPGLAELRGILCSRYDPADGIDQWSTLPGYRADDAEMKHLEAHERLQANQQIAPESRRILKRLTAGHSMPAAVMTEDDAPPPVKQTQIETRRRERKQVTGGER
ncbi:MAG: hypothetical protein WB676_06945, partial [Bryobacteraceae bacterium]